MFEETNSKNSDRAKEFLLYGYTINSIVFHKMPYRNTREENTSLPVFGFRKGPPQDIAFDRVPCRIFDVLCDICRYTDQTLSKNSRLSSS